MADEKGARQQPLPGLEHRMIAELQDAAMSYAEVAEKRKKLGVEEKALKEELCALMHKYNKRYYSFGNVHIDLTLEAEKVTVKIEKAEEAKPAEAVEEEKKEETVQ